jgi:uncharacterized protein (TIGR02246 family)
MTTTGTWGVASTILAEAGVTEDLSYYREFVGEDEKAVLTVPMRIQAAWAANDADAFANMFAENGSLLMQDHQMTDREQIRSYMADGFNGPLKGARVKGWPIAVRFLTADVAMVITEGGILLPGDDDLQPGNFIRSTWVISKQSDGTLRLVSHQSSPVKG